MSPSPPSRESIWYASHINARQAFWERVRGRNPDEFTPENVQRWSPFMRPDHSISPRDRLRADVLAWLAGGSVEHAVALRTQARQAALASMVQAMKALPLIWSGTHLDEWSELQRRKEGWIRRERHYQAFRASPTADQVLVAEQIQRAQRWRNYLQRKQDGVLRGLVLNTANELQHPPSSANDLMSAVQDVVVSPSGSRAVDMLPPREGRLAQILESVGGGRSARRLLGIGRDRAHRPPRLGFLDEPNCDVPAAAWAQPTDPSFQSTYPFVHAVYQLGFRAPYQEMRRVMLEDPRAERLIRSGCEANAMYWELRAKKGEPSEPGFSPAEVEALVDQAISILTRRDDKPMTAGQEAEWVHELRLDPLLVTDHESTPPRGGRPPDPHQEQGTLPGTRSPLTGFYLPLRLDGDRMVANQNSFVIGRQLTRAEREAGRRGGRDQFTPPTSTFAQPRTAQSTAAVTVEVIAVQPAHEQAHPVRAESAPASAVPVSPAVADLDEHPDQQDVTTAVDPTEGSPSAKPASSADRVQGLRRPQFAARPEPRRSVDQQAGSVPASAAWRRRTRPDVAYRSDADRAKATGAAADGTDAGVDFSEMPGPMPPTLPARPSAGSPERERPGRSPGRSAGH